MTSPEGEHHLVPSWDIHAHQWVDCACRPLYDGYGHIHSSWDGRELYEQGRAKHH